MKYLKTESGQQAFKARSKLFSARQRAVFILVDGVRTGAQVIAATSGLGATQDDLDYLVQQGFLAAELASSTVTDDAMAPIETDAAGAVVAAIEVPVAAFDARTAQERYAAAMPIATRITADLGLRGFMLNLAIEKASGFEELAALLPKIQSAAGASACVELERALKGQ